MTLREIWNVIWRHATLNCVKLICEILMHVTWMHGILNCVTVNDVNANGGIVCDSLAGFGGFWIDETAIYEKVSDANGTNANETHVNVSVIRCVNSWDIELQPQT